MNPPSAIRPHGAKALWINLVFAYVYLAWGGRFLAMRFALEGLSPLLISGARFALGGVLLLAWLRATDRTFRWGSARDWGEAAAVSFFLLIAGLAAVNWAQQYVPSGPAALLFGATPLWMVLVDWVRPGGRRPRGTVAVGMALGFVGVGVLVAPGVSSWSAGLLAAKLVLVTSGISWAVGAIYARHMNEGGSPLLPVARQMVAGGSLLLVGAWLAGDVQRFHAAAVTPRAWWAFVYLTVCGSLLGFMAYFWLLRVSSVAKVATVPYMNLAVAVALGCLCNHEDFDWNMFLGTATILVAVFLVMGKASDSDHSFKATLTPETENGPLPHRL